MNRLVLGIGCGIVFGLTDVLMTVFGNSPGVTRLVLLQAFFSRFAIGVLGANTTLGAGRILSGALAGLLISLPDAFALNSYLGVLSTGLIFGATTGWVSEKWGK